MHALLLPIGSTGDVLPFVAVAAPCARAATTSPSPPTRTSPGAYEYEAMCTSPKLMDRVHGFRFVMDFVSTLIRPIYDLVAAHRSSLVVAHPLAFGARVAEERLGVRTATLVLSPAILRSADGWMKRTMRWAADRLIVDRVVGPPLNAFRAAKGLPPITRVLSHGWDADHLHVALYPRWFAPPCADGPRRLVHAGFPLHDLNDAIDHEPILDERPIVFTAGTGQPDNAVRLARLGVASLVWPAHATGARIARRLQSLLDSPSVAERCRALADTVRPGVATACDLLERYGDVERALAGAA